MSVPNILFYSKRCPSCRNLMSIMGNDFLPYFQLVCVDGRINEMPRDLTAVPTLVIPGVGKFVTSDAFKYIQTQKFIKQQRQSQVHMQNQSKMVKNDPLGHNNMEMGGLSDEYAYQSDKVDKAQPKSYVNVGQENKNMIFTAPESTKIRESQQKNLVRTMEKKRKDEDEQFKVQAKQGQVDMLIEAEKRKMMESMNNDKGSRRR